MAEILAPEPSAARALALAGPARAQTGAMFDRLRGLTSQPAVAKSLPMIGLAGLAVLALLIWMSFAQGPQRDLFQNLTDGDKAAVADSLKTAGIKYSIDRDTGALTVTDADFYKAKMLLAQQGLPKSAPDGDAMISSLPMGASRAVEGERLRAARELDLARTIEAIDAVRSARVHIAQDQPSVFLRDDAKPAASVMLTLNSGRTLSDSQVSAISHLVASSVPGLSPDGVSIVDQSGRLLSRSGGDGATEASDRQVAIQQKIEGRYSEAIDKLLIPLVGADNYTSEVHADLDFAEVQATRETYPKDTAVVREEQGGWTKDGGPDGPAVGIPGALSNSAPPAAQVAAAPGGTLAAPTPGQAPAQPGTTAATQDAQRTTENYSRAFELGREVSVTKQPVGTVKRLSVAVALKQGKGKDRITPAAIAQLDALVKGAVGYDQARGDVVAINARDFAPVADPPSQPIFEKPWVPLLARNLSAMGIAALLIFGLARPFLKRQTANAGTLAAAKGADRSAVGRQIADALVSEARADPARPVTLDMIESAPGYAVRAELIRNFVRQDPSRAALVVRDLIRTDAASGGDQNG